MWGYVPGQRGASFLLEAFFEKAIDQGLMATSNKHRNCPM